MKIAYYTLDEVNRCFVSRWLKAAGAAMACPAGRSLTESVPGVAAVVLDFDSLPSEVAAEWVRKLLKGGCGRTVLVHGHAISDATAIALRSRGVRVCRTRVRKAALLRWVARRERRSVAVGGSF